MDGMAFLDALRLDKRWQNIPVAVITAKDLSSEETERLKHDTLEVVSKADMLTEELHRLLERILKRAEIARAQDQDHLRTS
jgi:CheY-like chemotaxis protein